MAHTTKPSLINLVRKRRPIVRRMIFFCCFAKRKIARVRAREREKNGTFGWRWFLSLSLTHKHAHTHSHARLYSFVFVFALFGNELKKALSVQRWSDRALLRDSVGVNEVWVTRSNPAPKANIMCFAISLSGGSYSCRLPIGADICVSIPKRVVHFKSKNAIFSHFYLNSTIRY